MCGTQNAKNVKRGSFNKLSTRRQIFNKRRRILFGNLTTFRFQELPIDEIRFGEHNIPKSATEVFLEKTLAYIAIFTFFTSHALIFASVFN